MSSSTLINSELPKVNDLYNIPSLLEKVLRIHFTIPNIVWITGDWKTGKTDCALFFAECLTQLGFIQHVATNIYTYGDMQEINDMLSLKAWLHQDREPKLFLFDEANVHLPSRRSMSRKNVELTQIFPEISKARGRMIVIGQEMQSVDKILKNKTWVRAVFHKVNLKTIILYSRLVKRPLCIGGIPKTHIAFDPYMIAPFTHKPNIADVVNDRDIKLLYEWTQGAITYKDVFNGNPNTFNRWCRKTVARVIEVNALHFTKRGGGIEEHQELS